MGNKEINVRETGRQSERETGDWEIYLAVQIKN
jgi:hypothetical protein